MYQTQIIENAVKCYYNYDIPDEVPNTLPLVDYFTKTNLRKEVFSGINALFIQHQLGPLFPKVKTMIQHGLEPSRCWFVDIPYSTYPPLRDHLIKLGCPTEQMAEPFNDPISPYSKIQIERVMEIMKNLEGSKNGRILVIDDGAYFIRALIQYYRTEKTLVHSLKERGTSIVEQTTRGHQFLQEPEHECILDLLGIPVVSVARADTKYKLESPFIGASVAMATTTALQKDHHSLNNIEKALLIGFGAVGKEVTKELRRIIPEAQIDVYDINWRNKKKEIKEIGAKSLEQIPFDGEYDAVFGCTGKSSFPFDRTHILADDAKLISGSSAAVEFNREDFIDQALIDANDDFYVRNLDETRQQGIHASIKITKNGKNFSFLSAGFPVNFTGAVECLPTKIIQITHGLLLAAANQVLTRPKIGFNEICKEYDNWFTLEGLKEIEEFVKNYGAL
jgi:S-adenosylhomocysteine hydrolase